MWAVWVEIPWPGRCPPPQTTPLLLKFCGLPTKQLCYSNFIESHTHNPSCLFSAFYSIFIPFHSPGSSSPLAQCFANSFQRITYQIKHYFLPVLPLSLLQPSPSSSLKNRRFFSVPSPKPIIIFFPEIQSTLSPHCLSHHLLLCSDPKPPFSLLSTSSFIPSQLKIYLKTLLTALPPCILLMVFQSPSHQPYIIHQPSVWFSCWDEPTTAIYAEQYCLFVFLCSPICLSICSPLFYTPILSSWGRILLFV